MQTATTENLVGKEFFYYVCGNLVRKGKFVRYDGDYGILESGIYGGIYDKINLKKLIPVDPNEPYIQHDESKESPKSIWGYWPWFFVGWFIGNVLWGISGLL